VAFLKEKEVHLGEDEEEGVDVSGDVEFDGIFDIGLLGSNAM
jgi:hypothetical protein